MFKGKEDYGFIWEYFEIIVLWLYKHLPYRLLVKKLAAENFRSFADIFVILYSVISIVFANVMLKFTVPPVIMFILLFYILYRVYEIVIYALYTFFIVGYKKRVPRSERVASSRRTLLFFLVNIFELTNIFIMTGVFWRWINNSEYFTKSYIDSFITNFYCFITFNPDALEEYGLKYLAFIEVLFGSLFILLIISRVLGGFRSYDALEDED